MYFTEDFLHFSLKELQCICSLVSLFDDKLAKRIDNIYSYHRYTLHEPENQPLMLHLTEILDFRRKFHFTKVVQPEFIFSDDEEIF